MKTKHLTFEHNPDGYKMVIRLAAFADRHVIFQTGDLGVISLSESEVKQVINWLQDWLNEGETQQQEQL